MHPDLNTLSWYVARSTGLMAWWVAGLSVLWGLLASTRYARARWRSVWVVDLHRYLGALTVGFVAVHITALELDMSEPHIPLRAVVVPMTSPWRPGAVTAGVLAMYLVAAIEVTSFLMHRLPRRVWHAVHLTSVVVLVAGTVHAFTAGSDRGNPAVQWSALLLVTAFVFLGAYRVLDATVGIEKPAPVRVPGR